MSGHSQFALFRERRFMPFFGTMAFGALNDNVVKNALGALLVFQSSRLVSMNTDQLVNFSAMLFILPFFLFSALFGQVADKYEKSMQIRRIKLFEVGIMLVATLGFYLDNLPLLLSVLFLLGLQSTMFGPIKYGILPQVLDQRELVGGNALVEMGTFVAILVGTIMGPQLAGIDSDWPIWVSGTALAIAFVGYLFSLGIPRAAAADPDLRLNWNIATETVRNIRFINQNPTVLNSVLGISWFWFFGAIVLVNMLSYSKNVVGGDENMMSALLGMFIIGISAGSLLCERLSGRQVEIGLVPFGAIGLSLFSFDLFLASPDAPVEGISIGVFFSSAANWRIAVDMALIGVFGGFYTVPLYALVQQRSKASHRSRVIAGLNILNSLFMVTASVMSMLLLAIDGFRIPELFMLIAILNALVSIYIFTIVPEFLLRFLMWLLIHSIYRVRVTGREHLPETGPVILASNHVSFVDPLIIGGIIRRPIRFVMYFKIHDTPGLRWLFKAGKAIPIASRSERPELVDEAYARIRDELAQGEPIGIFPEGSISRDGEIQSFKKGIDKILDGQQQPVPVVPMALCHLWGSLFSRRDPMHKRRPYKLWSRIELRIGEPLAPEQASAERLEREIRALRGPDR